MSSHRTPGDASIMSLDRFDASSLSWPSQESHGSACGCFVFTFGDTRLLFTLAGTLLPIDLFEPPFTKFGGFEVRCGFPGAGDRESAQTGAAGVFSGVSRACTTALGICCLELHCCSAGCILSRRAPNGTSFRIDSASRYCSSCLISLTKVS